jgi:EAL domain-containing protein (putative c-di-GMP-specific phosphodiesterase class I)
VAGTVQKMRALKEIGVCFSMDDFGTGQSSLTYLKHLPLDQIKVDQHFVRNVVTDPVDAIMVGTIICMANNLGLEVISEGVETEEQMAFLMEHGCNAFQGYLFSKPVSLEEFEQLLQSRLILGNIRQVRHARKKVVSACTRCNKVNQRTMETASAS